MKHICFSYRPVETGGGWRAAAPQISAKVEVLPIDIDSE